MSMNPNPHTLPTSGTPLHNPNRLRRWSRAVWSIILLQRTWLIILGTSTAVFVGLFAYSVYWCTDEVAKVEPATGTATASTEEKGEGKPDASEEAKGTSSTDSKIDELGTKIDTGTEKTVSAIEAGNEKTAATLKEGFEGLKEELKSFAPPAAETPADTSKKFAVTFVWKQGDAPPTLDDMPDYPYPNAENIYYVYVSQNGYDTIKEPYEVHYLPKLYLINRPDTRIIHVTQTEMGTGINVPEGWVIPEGNITITKDGVVNTPAPHSINPPKEKIFDYGFLGLTLVDPKHPEKGLGTYISTIPEWFIISPKKIDGLVGTVPQRRDSSSSTEEQKAPSTQPATKPVVETPSSISDSVVTTVPEPIWEPVAMQQPWRDGKYRLDVRRLTDGGEVLLTSLEIPSTSIVKKCIMKKDGNIFDMKIAIEDKDGNLLKIQDPQNPGTNLPNPLPGVLEYCPLSPPRGYTRGSR